MSKTYRFEFPGTREMFFEKLNQHPSYDHTSFHFSDYIVNKSGEDYTFGIQRGGHSGGYWFKPTITEEDGKLLFCGEIEYINAHSGNKKYSKALEKLDEVLLTIVLLPLILVFKAYVSIKFLIQKIRKQPIIKEETEEDRLFNLMENLLGCTRMY